MNEKPADVLGSMTKGEQNLLDSILRFEADYLHMPEITANTSLEREIVAKIKGMVDKAIQYED